MALQKRGQPSSIESHHTETLPLSFARVGVDARFNSSYHFFFFGRALSLYSPARHGTLHEDTTFTDIMNKATVLGISIGVALLVVLIITCILVLLYLRRRKHRRTPSSSQWLKQPPDHRKMPFNASNSQKSHKDPTRTVYDVNNFHVERPTERSEWGQRMVSSADNRPLILCETLDKNTVTIPPHVRDKRAVGGAHEARHNTHALGQYDNGW